MRSTPLPLSAMYHSQRYSSLSRPLLNHTNDQNSRGDDCPIGKLESVKKKMMIRVKSDSTDSSTDDDSGGSEGVEVEEPLAFIRNHRYLSPSKPSSKALVMLLLSSDFAVGAYLISHSLLHMQDKDYSYLMFTLTSGLLLLSGSLAGICLHTSLGRLCCGSDADMRRAMMIFNTSFAFIAVGIYYMLGLSLLMSPLFSKSFENAGNLQIAIHCALSLVGFGFSMLEGYRIIFIHYQYHSDEETQESQDNDRTMPFV